MYPKINNGNFGRFYTVEYQKTFKKTPPFIISPDRAGSSVIFVKKHRLKAKAGTMIAKMPEDYAPVNLNFK